MHIRPTIDTDEFPFSFRYSRPSVEETGMTMILMVLLTALAAGQAVDGPPDLRRTEEGELVVEAPDIRRTTYRVQFNPSTRLSAAERLQRLIELEPFEIVEEDVGAATATIRLSPTAVDRLVRPDGWQHLGVTSITPQPPTSGPRCTGIDVALQPPESRIGMPEPCPRSETARGIVIEGLDALGARLWIATAEDPRNVRSVMGPNGEPHITGRDERRDLFASIAVPTIDGLATLRWYEVTEDDQLRRIGESTWNPTG
jgi:hypothetical protein